MIFSMIYDQCYNTKRPIQTNLNKLCTWFMVIQVKQYESEYIFLGNLSTVLQISPEQMNFGYMKYAWKNKLYQTKKAVRLAPLSLQMI